MMERSPTYPCHLCGATSVGVSYDRFIFTMYPQPSKESMKSPSEGLAATHVIRFCPTRATPW